MIEMKAWKTIATVLSVTATSLFLLVVFSLAAFCATNLRLKDGISFVQDTDNGFPIVADKMDDVSIAQGMPTLIFFGAAADLNTNRQAKRLVDLYKKFQDKIKVIVIDVDHPANTDALKLIKTYYKGYIPLNVILDKAGKLSSSHSGEVETGELKSKIERAM
ncbi:MAG: hypothetical protein C0507_21245 [Cyanobacteria bacterium PR.3.49]|jgi:butyrate kinase|nr:hypothetical protein [Cyanobacteria bacterium PR.3.49]